jgi:hypothetical protein
MIIAVLLSTTDHTVAMWLLLHYINAAVTRVGVIPFVSCRFALVSRCSNVRFATQMVVAVNVLTVTNCRKQRRTTYTAADTEFRLTLLLQLLA